MINSVSSVNFGSTMVQGQNPLNRPGKYTMPNTTETEVAPKKKSKFLKGLAIALVATAAVLGGLALGAHKGIFKVLDADALADAKIMQKVGHYLGKAGNAISTTVGGAWNRITNLFRKNAQAAAQNVAP